MISAETKAEQAVLGCCLLKPAVIHDLATLLNADDFVLPAHRKIWEAACAIADSLDVITLIAELNRRHDTLAWMGAPGSEGTGEDYLLDLSGSVGHAENAGHYAEIVKSASLSRKLISACLEAAGESQGGDGYLSAIQALRRKLDAIETGSAKSETVRLGDIQEQVAADLEKRWQDPDTWLVRTGIDALDNLIGGFKPEQQIVVASNPGEGKSSFVWATMIRAALRGVPCLVFSLEMSIFELCCRAWAFQSDATELGHTRPNSETWRRVHQAMKDLKGAPLHINDRASTWAQIEAASNAWRRTYPTGIALIATDYVGIVRSELVRGRSREQQIAEVSGGGKAMAKRLKVAHVLVSQLNRENTKTQDGETRRPKKSDLKDSGSLEADADVVIMPWQRTLARDEDGNLTDWENYLIVDKNRDGQCGAAKVRFDRKRFGFFDIHTTPGRAE